MEDASRSASIPEVLVYSGEPDEACRQLATQLDIALIAEEHHAQDSGLFLQWKAGTLSLARRGGRELPVAVDFAKALQQRRQGPELLLKAVGGRPSARPAVVDATAGLGRDSAVLLSKGCRVSMIEENPVIAALLHNALQRLGGQTEFAGYRSHISLIAGRAEQELPALAAQGLAQVVYLDPMFAASGKSALAKKDMQMFHQLLGHGDDGAKLLETALAYAEYRVVVKRALKAEPLGRREPGFAVKGKAVRFDVYPLKSLQGL